MEVLKSNFDVILPELLQKIKSADFVAFDLELTGIGASSEIRLLPIDTPAQRYRKYRASATSYKPTQFGICSFQWNPISNKYDVFPFNVYIFQQKYKNVDPAFLSSSASLSFLASHSFDFNKWIKEGISYLSRQQEAAVRKNRSELLAARASGDNDITLAPEDEKFINELVRQVKEWLLLRKKGEGPEALALAPVSSYHRRLTYQELSKRFPDLALKTEQDPVQTNRFISVSFMTAEERAQKEKERLEEAERDLDHAVGFRKVIDCLIESKKPLIGHNCFLDLLHLYHQFIEDLPVSYAHFKATLSELFPKVFDTKQMLHQNPAVQAKLGGSTVLGDMFKKLTTDLKIDLPFTLATGFEKYQSSQDLHEAGADAYITGVAFLGICDMITAPKPDEETQIGFPHKVTGEIVDGNGNKLHMMRIRGHMRLGGDDEFPSRDHLLWVHGLTSEVKTSDLNPYFAPTGKFRVHWIDESSCVIDYASPDAVTPDLVAKLNAEAPFSVKPVADMDAALEFSAAEKEEATEDEESSKTKPKRPATDKKAKRKRENIDEGALTDPEDAERHKSKRRRLSVGNLECSIQ